MEKFVITKDYMRRMNKFNTKARTLEFHIRPVPENTEPTGWIKDAIKGIIRTATKNLEPTDMVGFTFCSREFERGQGWLRFQEASKVSVDDIWNIINGIFQSNSTGLNTETFCFGVTSVKMPIGKGRGKMYNSFQEECNKRRGIVTINNKDNMCLPRALVVAKAFADKDPQYNKVRKDAEKLQTSRAKQLVEEARIEIPTKGCGIKELQIFQQHLEGYRIVVYRYGSKGRDIIFTGSEGTNLNLIHHNGHYNVIISCTAAFSCSYYCETCNVPYDHQKHHRCIKSCHACQKSPPCELGMKIKCVDCLRTFSNQSCFNNHKERVCQEIKLCPNCLKTINSNREHTCGEIFCKICLKHQSEGHLCFMQIDKKLEQNKTSNLFVFYDLETRQEKQLSDGSLLHEPNLCIYQQCCEKCMQESNLLFCQTCGFRRKVFKKNVVSQFMNYLTQIRKKFKNVVVLAHNGQAFDHQFILAHILSETDLTPELIMRGTKIIMMQMQNVKFLDSVNYFPMALSALPKAFGLPDKFKKGYFPHLFNKEENQNYVAILPPVEYYSPDTMKEEYRNEFLKWYDEQKHKEFDFQKELVDYCTSDVQILTEACLKFREQMITTANVCPFTEACTIASTCNKVFRRNFLKPNTIGIIPKGGYRYRDNQSKKALEWLIWMEYHFNIKIHHAAKGQETVLHGSKVDGFSDSSNQVFEFHGCYWHGCPSCFKYQRDKPLVDNPLETLNFRYESTVAKVERLRSLGYEVVEKWECEFQREIEENPEMYACIKANPLFSFAPLNPRDAFYGGRTGNCKTYYKASGEEKIKYVDVCSLYPWVCKYGKFPVGHPTVFVGDDCKNLNLKETDGLIKCKIIAPQNLYHPVLPQKINSKLMFVLCRACGEQMVKEDCNHSGEERALTGTWVIDEVLKACEKGYRILEIYEVWKYKVEQYDSDQKVGGLFVDMMNKFIKIKQEASGWPSDCTTTKQKEAYIDAFFQREGVKLEFGAISKNAGLRCLSKLMLNSFWGKLGQQENQPKTVIINKPEDYFNMLTNPSIEVNSVLPVNDDVLLLNYELKEESYDPLSTVNVCLAAYTTAQARLKLYSYLEQLDDRVLYYDTDSVIFAHKEGDYEPATGDFIGEMTDELEAHGPGSYILEFVSGGPKNYAYKFYSTAEKQEKVVCKVKGISLNYNAAKLLNFETIKNAVLTESEPILICNKGIRRTNEHEVVTREETKLYKPNSLKRKFLEDHNSVPYGFKKK